MPVPRVTMCHHPSGDAEAMASARVSSIVTSLPRPCVRMWVVVLGRLD